MRLKPLQRAVLTHVSGLLTSAGAIRATVDVFGTTIGARRAILAAPLAPLLLVLLIIGLVARLFGTALAGMTQGAKFKMLSVALSFVTTAIARIAPGL